MNNDNFKWTDELVSECYREIRRRLDNPNEYEGTWEGISKEILKFKASNTSSNEKDWEVIKMKTSDTGNIHDPNDMCEQMDCTIHSVRRKSDATVWAVGDILEKWGKISSFKIQCDKWMLAICNDGGDKPAHVFIEDFTQPLPKRTKLFTELQRIEHLEERIAYIEKKLNIEG